MDPELAEALPSLPRFTHLIDSSGKPCVDMTRTAQAARADELQIEDRVVGKAGALPLWVRVYRPKDVERPLGVMLRLHGGGFCLGSVDAEHPRCVDDAAALGCVVVAVEYRLAPAHPFPAGPDDCFAALDWVVGHADELGVDPSRLVLSGTSAGGGLAAAVALMARDRSGPSIALQHLEFPALDDRLTSWSATSFTDTPLLNRSLALEMWDYYLGPQGGPVSPYAAPARATDMRDLPPAYICTAELDPLRDEGLSYGMRLLEAGVSVELHSFPGTFHGYERVADAAITKRLQAERRQVLGRVLSGEGTALTTYADGAARRLSPEPKVGSG